MINYIDYLNMPAKVAVILVACFLTMQVVGEILEFKGKVVPECIKVRKYFKRKKQEKETFKEMATTINDMKALFNDFNNHYNSDNIQMRNEWIKGVNCKMEQTEKWIKEFDKKLDRNNQATISLIIDNKRNTIIDFASFVIDEKSKVTREQFNRIFKMYEEYEDIINKNGLTNGEVDIAIRIIKEEYEKHLRNHSFVEETRGYDNI